MYDVSHGQMTPNHEALWHLSYYWTLKSKMVDLDVYYSAHPWAVISNQNYNLIT